MWEIKNKYWKIGKVVYYLDNGYFYKLKTGKQTHQLLRAQWTGSVLGLCVKTARIEYGFKPDDDSS
jgi:hypothetical protein